MGKRSAQASLGKDSKVHTLVSAGRRAGGKSSSERLEAAPQCPQVLRASLSGAFEMCSLSTLGNINPIISRGGLQMLFTCSFPQRDENSHKSGSIELCPGDRVWQEAPQKIVICKGGLLISPNNTISVIPLIVAAEMPQRHTFIYVSRPSANPFLLHPLTLTSRILLN